MIEPFPIPDSWVWTRVGNLYKIVGGGTPSTSQEGYWNGSIPWITSADIHGLRDIRPRRTVTEDGIRNSATNLVPKDSIIVVTRVGLGKLALTEYPLCFSQDSQALVGNSQFVDPLYSLYYLSHAVQIFKYQGRGTTISGVTKKQLHDLEFPLAPYAEQKRIVAKIEELFSRLDVGMRSLEQAQKQMGSYRRSLLATALDGRLTSQWRKKNPVARPRADTVSERPTGIPGNWAWVTLGSITQPSKERYQPNKSESRVYLGLEHIESGTGRILGTGDSSDVVSFKSVFKAGDVLYGRLRPYLNKVTVPMFDGVCSTDILVFPKSPSFDSRYLSYVLLFPRFVEFTSARMAGVQHPRIKFATMSDYALPLPPVAEQRAIGDLLEHSISVAQTALEDIETNLVKSRNLRRSILRITFVGGLVSQDSRDEPAGLLLERIRNGKEALRRHATR